MNFFKADSVMERINLKLCYNTLSLKIFHDKILAFKTF